MGYYYICNIGNVDWLDNITSVGYGAGMIAYHEAMKRWPSIVVASRETGISRQAFYLWKETGYIGAKLELWLLKNPVAAADEAQSPAEDAALPPSS